MKIVQRHPAIIDVERIIDDLIGSSGTKQATRCRKSLEKSYAELVRFPYLGPPRDYGVPGVRRWKVDRFPEYLIFYVPTDKTIEIIRVIHGARDLPRLMSTPQD